MLDIQEMLGSRSQLSLRLPWSRQQKRAAKVPESPNTQPSPLLEFPALPAHWQHRARIDSQSLCTAVSVVRDSLAPWGQFRIPPASRGPLLVWAVKVLVGGLANPGRGRRGADLAGTWSALLTLTREIWAELSALVSGWTTMVIGAE